MLFEELLKLGLYDNRESVSSKLFTEEAFWLFRSMTTLKEEQSLEDLVLIVSKLLSKQIDI